MARRIPKIVGFEIENDGSVTFIELDQSTRKLVPLYTLSKTACLSPVYTFAKSKVYHKSPIFFYHPTFTAGHLHEPLAMTRKEALLKGFSFCRNCN